MNESQNLSDKAVETILATVLMKLEEDETMDTDAYTNAHNIIIELELRGYMIVKCEDVKDFY